VTADAFASSDDELDATFDQVRRQVADLAAAQSRGEEAEAVGEAADGMVRVTATGGRVSKVELDPRVMRMQSAMLAEEFARAANAALDALRDQYAAGAPPLVDAAALADELDRVHDDGIRAMRRYSESISHALAQVTR